MAKKVRIVLHSSGAKAVLTQGDVQAELMKYGEGIAAKANAQSSPDEMTNFPFTAVNDSTAKRARVRVLASNPHGIRAQERLTNNLR